MKDTETCVGSSLAFDFFQAPNIFSSIFYFVLFSLISFCFRWFRLISFRFVSISFRTLQVPYNIQEKRHLFINTKKCIWHNTLCNVSFHTILYFLLMQLTHEYISVSTFRKELQKFIFNCFYVLILYRLSIRSFIVVITHFLPSFLSFLLQKKTSYVVR